MIFIIIILGEILFLMYAYRAKWSAWRKMLNNGFDQDEMTRKYQFWDNVLEYAVLWFFLLPGAILGVIKYFMPDLWKAFLP